VVAVTPPGVNRVETLCVATPPHAATQQTLGNGIPGSLDHRRGVRAQDHGEPCGTDEVHDQVATLVTAYGDESADIGDHGT
jgi:hypothetical protein